MEELYNTTAYTDTRDKDNQYIDVNSNVTAGMGFRGTFVLDGVALNTYTVTWIGADGTALETDTVSHGDQPSYDGATPVKTGDAANSYTFTGWATSANQTAGVGVSELPAVTASVTYYAAFAPVGYTYTVTVDGFVVSDNVKATARNIDTGFAYSDHNPVLLTFELQ